MRKLFIALLLPLMAFCVGCNNNGKKTDTATEQKEANVDAADSTVYGVCGEGTAMHTLQLITDTGDTIEYALIGHDDTESEVSGGLMCGDRLAVMAQSTDEGLVANKVINLTSLMGRWTSIDKNFVIEEGGIVSSNVKAESHPWTNWKIFNGQLLLNRDTFDVVQLGSDSLAIENAKGIFVFKRQLQ